jgi:integrase
MAYGDFSHGAYRLSWLKGEACAVKGSGSGRQRFRLGVRIEDGEEAARSALTAFSLREQSVQIRIEGTVEALWNAYRADREKDGKVMRAFDGPWKNLRPFFGRLKPSEIDADQCREYAKMRFASVGRKGKKRVSQDTVWTELNKLGSCLSWSAKARLIGQHKHDVPPMWFPSRTKKSDDVLTPEDVLKLLDACTFEVDTSQGAQLHEMFHLRLFVILACCTAGRPTALLELVGKRCLFGHSLIDLRVEAEDDPMSKAYKKGRAIVHMNDLARHALLEAKARIEAYGRDWDSAHVIQFHGQGIQRIHHAFNRAVERAGLPAWVTPHKLRHATATWADAAGLDPAMTAAFLGHAKPQVTEARYIHRKGQKTKAAAEAVNDALGGRLLRAVK